MRQETMEILLVQNSILGFICVILCCVRGLTNRLENIVTVYPKYYFRL